MFQGGGLRAAGRRVYACPVMDGVSSVSGGTMDIASGGTSAVAMNVLASTEQFQAQIADQLFASMGIGSAVNALA